MIMTFPRALAVLCAIASVPAAAVTFETVFPQPGDFGEEERARIRTHVAAAGRQWIEYLPTVQSGVTITVEVRMSSIPTATGRSLWTGYVGRVGELDIWEQGMAHELRTGVDANGDGADVEFVLGEHYLRDTLWLPADPGDARVPAERVDAFSVILHEFGHALAYNGWADGLGRVHHGYASNWDAWLLDAGATGSVPLFAGPEAGAAWGSAPEVTLYNPSHLGNADPVARQRARAAGRAWFGPPPVVAFDAVSGSPVPLPACGELQPVPAPRTGMDAKALPVGGLLAQLMNGVVFHRGHRYAISPLDLGVLRDVGLEARGTALHADGFEAARAAR